MSGFGGLAQVKGSNYWGSARVRGHTRAWDVLVGVRGRGFAAAWLAGRIWTREREGNLA